MSLHDYVLCPITNIISRDMLVNHFVFALFSRLQIYSILERRCLYWDGAQYAQSVLNIPYNWYKVFALCCALLWFVLMSFTHILEYYFAGIGVVMRFPRSRIKALTVKRKWRKFIHIELSITPKLQRSSKLCLCLKGFYARQLNPVALGFPMSQRPHEWYSFEQWCMVIGQRWFISTSVWSPPVICHNPSVNGHGRFRNIINP